MIIKILGTGCDKCDTLEENVKEAINELGIEASIEKIESLLEIVKYGVMTSPTLIIDEKIVATGKVLKVKKIKELIEKNQGAI